MKLDFTRYAPPGINLKQEKGFFITSMLFALCYSFGFLLRYGHAHSNLYVWRAGTRVLKPNILIEDFTVLLDHALAGFLVISLCMVAMIAYHYSYYHQGSKSIYLMRRVPDARLLHLQCLTLPLSAIGICVLSAMLLLLIYYMIYMIITPDSCLPAGQWHKIWRVFP